MTKEGGREEGKDISNYEFRLPVPWQTGTCLRRSRDRQAADRDCGFDQGAEPSHLRLRRRVVVSPDLRTCQCTCTHKEAVLLSQSQELPVRSFTHRGHGGMLVTRGGSP